MTKRLFLLVAVAWFSLLGQAETYTHYSEWMVASEMKRTPHPYNLNFSSWWPQWSYQVGVELDPMLDVYLEYNNSKVWNYLKEYPQTMVQSNGSITGYNYDEFNLDNVRPGHFLFRMYQQAPADKELKALNTLFKQLENQPRTQNGVWWHKEVYHWQVWLDGVFMGMPFYVLAAPTLKPGEEEKYYEDAVNQMTTTDQMTYDAPTELWKHAWDETHSIFWADKTTGRSQHTWGRALGWYAMALVEVLETMPESYARRAELLGIFKSVMASVSKYQDESGVWYDVLDVDDPRNYLEATCSSMFCYCLLKGVRMGWIDAEYLPVGVKAFRGIVNEFVKENSDGTISLQKCCEVSGLGPENRPQRDGSFEYYMSEPVRDNDPKGVGPFMWAALEMERLGYTVQNLFNDDVEPDGIAKNIIAHPDEMGVTYSLDGRKVEKSYKGIVIRNGNKIMCK